MTPDQIHQKIKGQRFKVHNLTFEVMELEGILKIIPRTELEEDDRVYTLPITHIRMKAGTQGTKINIKNKPRRIDIGGPYLIALFIIGLITTGGILMYFLGSEYYNVAYIVLGAAILIFLIFSYKMYTGYYDYIRKINAWVKGNL